jgi:hypothetical protein
MNSEENVINQLKADKAVLEAQLVQVRADYNALNMIQTNVNNSLLDANKEIRQLKTELALKNNEITVLSNPIWTNYRYVQFYPLPMKLAVGGTVTYKICDTIMSSDENKENLKEDTEMFSLIENSKVESLAPKPISKTNYQNVVEVSVAPMIHEIKLVNQSMWFSF